ncbi:hypothetical protein BU17DRAFT_81088 [Hysterangium stoloniferum]|nr:hypothetical protein BU17DRAFT_81088 [Hysterangium stoloniferum]
MTVTQFTPSHLFVIDHHDGGHNMTTHKLQPLIKILLSLSFVVATRAFTFTYTPPTECDPFTISWQGGQAPFEILLVPAFDSPRNFSVPSLPDGNAFTLQLPLLAGRKFLVTLSDVSGFASGGVSDILTVGASTTGAVCSTDVPHLNFLFSIDSPLQQCAPLTISGYSNAVQPVTLTGLVPLGTSVQILSTVGSTSLVWNPANIPAGTNVVFFLVDSQGNFGGSSNITQAAASANNGCINAQSPHSTADANSGGPAAISQTVTQGTPTSTGSDSTMPTQSTVTSTSGQRVSPAAIGGAVVGCLVAILLLGTLSMFFLRTYLPSKRDHSRFSRRYSATGMQRGPMPPINYTAHNPLAAYGPVAYHSTVNSPGAPSSQWTTFSSSTGDNSYITEPFEVPANAIPLSYPHSTREPTHEVNHSDPLQGGHLASSTWSSKSAAGPPSQRPTRFILHTDAEEAVELPPQYSDRLRKSAPPMKPL